MVTQKRPTIQKMKLPWNDDPRLGHYIDDNALYVLNSISRERFVGSGTSYRFLASCKPFEWSHKTMIRFLIRASEEYGIELKNFETMPYAFAEEYEQPIFDEKTGKLSAGLEKAWEKYSEEYKKYKEFKKKHNVGPNELFPKGHMPPVQPKKYGWAYKWALEEMKNKPQTAKGKLLSRMFDNKFDITDLKEALKISDWILPMDEDEYSESFLAKEIFNSIIDYTSFEVMPDKKTAKTLRNDLDNYLESFIKNRLKMSSRERKVGEILVLQNPNIYTFNKHKEMILARFQEMRGNYGDTFEFENPFEEIPFEEDNKESIQQRYAAKQFLFMHTIYAFEKLGYIKILALGNNWHWANANDDNLKYYAKIQLLPPLYQGRKHKIGGTNKTDKISWSYDPSTGILSINGKPVQFKKNNFRAKVLELLTKNSRNINKKWSWDEIYEAIERKRTEEKLGKEEQDKVYYACEGITEQIATKSGVTEFLLFDTNTARINPLLLP